MNTKKLMELREAAQLPPLTFDECDTTGDSSKYKIEGDDGSYPGIFVRVGAEYSEDGARQDARAEYVALACNAVPQLIEEHAALLEACVSAHIAMVALGNDANWNGIPQSYADAINALRAAIAQAEVQDGH